MTQRRGIPSGRALRTRPSRRLAPACERLETLSLLSNVSPVVSGYVFADKNNDGRLEAGESPVAGTQVKLRNESGAVVGTTTTNAKGYYAFSTDATVNTAPKSIAQTLVLPSAYTNIDGAAFPSALQLFDPSLGTLLDVKVTTVATVATTLGGENTSVSNPGDIRGSVSGSYEFDGLPEGPVSGTVSASTPVFHAGKYDGTTDFAGTSGVTFSLDPSDVKRLTFTSAADLARFTATAWQPSVTPTATIHASIAENGSSGNTQYTAATKGSAELMVTFDYAPNNALKTGTYVIVPTLPAGYVHGRVSSNDGSVVSSLPGSAIAISLTSFGSPQNDFGLLPAPKPSPSASQHKPAPVTRPVVPSTGHPTGHSIFSRFRICG